MLDLLVTGRSDMNYQVGLLQGRIWDSGVAREEYEFVPKMPTDCFSPDCHLSCGYLLHFGPIATKITENCELLDQHITGFKK